MAPAARSLPVWLLAFVAAVFAAWVSRRRESAQLRGLFRQLDVGRRHYEAERWEAADDALGAELVRPIDGSEAPQRASRTGARLNF
jgi:hypothetical protein